MTGHVMKEEKTERGWALGELVVETMMRKDFVCVASSVLSTMEMIQWLYKTFFLLGC